ncbi:MAG: ABC transporter permease [Myxococcales bacterium]|nr:ABC transporter permease [Myxococcales bacterium]MCB9642745.1 ABC transporter permease [Myxococcales bacterium]
MRLWNVFRKSVREQLREPWGLALTLGTAPFFVLLYWLFFGGSTPFVVLVLEEGRIVKHASKKPKSRELQRKNKTSLQEQTPSTPSVGEQLVKLLGSLKRPRGGLLMKVSLVGSRAEAQQRLAQKQAAALVILPQGLSGALGLGEGDNARERKKLKMRIVGDFTDPLYAGAAIALNAALERFVREATNSKMPVDIAKEAIARSDQRTEFENYVPGLLILSVVMLIFSAAMTITYEVEMGTLRRLQLSNISAFELLSGIAFSQVLLGVLSILLTFGVAVALGFRSQGPLWVAILVGAVTSLSIMGVAMIVASFARTVTEAFLLSNFPLFLLMFFSGAVRPIPKVPLLTLWGREVGLYDLLQPTHAVVALNKILTLGASLSEVLFEILAVLCLTILYFGVGVGLFHLRRMRIA